MLFSINYWIAKGLMPESFLPMQIIFFRVSGSLLLYFLFEVFFLKGKLKPIEKDDLPRLILAGLLGVALNQILFFSGLNLTTPIDTAIINATNPIIVMLISALLAIEKLAIKNFFGILLGAAGAVSLIFLGKSGGILEGGMLGNSLILANTFCWSLYLVVVKPLFTKYHPMQVMKWVFLFGFIFSLPVTVCDLFKLNPSSIPENAYWSLAYIIIGTTFLAYLLITYGLKNLSPTAVSVYTYAQPVIVAVIGLVFLDELLTASKGISFAMVLAGIILTSKK